MSLRPVPVLLYHAVVPDDDERSGRWSITKSAFNEHLDLLGEEHMTPLFISDYAHALRGNGHLPQRPVVVTFDDGFANFLQCAVPALSRRAIPSTIYIPTSALVSDGHEPFPGQDMLDPTDLPILEGRGVEIGAHSHTHCELDTLTNDQAITEIRRPKSILEQVLGHEVRSFAYPHGYSDPRIRRLVEQSGYRSACAVRNALSSAEDNIFAISRLSVERDTSTSTIGAWLNGVGAPISTGSERLRTHLWRICRRSAHRYRELYSHEESAPVS